MLDSNGQVWRLVPGGTPELYIASAVAAKISIPLLRLPRAIAVDQADNLYIRQVPFDSSIVGVRIYVISPTGTVGQKTNAAPDFLLGSPDPQTIAIDRAGNVWETSSASAMYAAGPTFKGQSLTSFGFEGDDGPITNARFNGPISLTVGPDGSVFVLDSRNSRVRRISGATLTAAPSIASGSVVNAGSLLAGPIAPGELVSIFGAGLGPPWPVSFTVRDNAIPLALGSIQVLFDGQPAPVTAVSANQINVFVPFGISAKANAQVVVKVDGVASPAITMPVASSAFGLFTASASGTGQAAALNQDNSYNNAGTPAAAGSIVSFYGTGAGAMTPAEPDGAIVTSIPLPQPDVPVTVSIGGQNAEVLYAGAAPSLPAGVLQINARIPAGMPRGDAAVAVTVGGLKTTRVVTVAVQ